MVTIPVPAYHGAQALGGVAPDVARTPELRLQAPDTSSTGRLLGELGRGLAGLNLQLKARKDDMWLLEAEREMTEKLKDYNSPNGFRSRSGVNAAGISDAINGDWTSFSGDIRKRYNGRLSPDSMAALEKSLMTNGLKVNGTVTTHEIGQVKAATIEGLKAAIGNAVDAAAASVDRDMATAYMSVDVGKSTIGDATFDDSFSAGLQNIDGRLAALQAEAGMTDEAAAEMRRVYTTSLVTQRIAALAAEDGRAALNFLELSNKAGLLTGEAYTKLIGPTTEMSIQSTARVKAVTAVNEDVAAIASKKIITIADETEKASQEQVEILMRSHGRAPTSVGFTVAFKEAMDSFVHVASLNGMHITISSGYRSPAHQADLITQYLPNYLTADGSPVPADVIAQWRKDSAGGNGNAIAAGQKWRAYFEGLKRADGEAGGLPSWVGMPGGSRHNHGLAADIRVNGRAVSELSAEEREQLVSLAGQVNLHFPLGNEDWHVELQGADGGRIAVGQSGVVSGRDKIEADIRNAKSDLEVRQALATADAYYKTHTALDQSRVAFQNEAFTTATDAILESMDDIALGTVTLAEAVPPALAAEMGAGNYAQIVDVFKRMQAGEQITTDKTEGSAFLQAYEILKSGDDPNTVAQKFSALASTAAYRLSVSNEDHAKIVELVQAYGKADVPSSATINTAVTRMLTATGMATNKDKNKPLIAQIATDVQMKLIAYSAGSGEQLDENSPAFHRIIREASQKWQSGVSGDDGLSTREMINKVSDTAREKGHAAAVRDIIEGGMSAVAASGSPVDIKEGQLQNLWEALVQVHGDKATVYTFLDAVHDYTLGAADPTEATLYGTPLTTDVRKVFRNKNLADALSEVYPPGLNQTTRPRNDPDLLLPYQITPETDLAKSYASNFFKTNETVTKALDTMPPGLGVDETIDWLKKQNLLTKDQLSAFSLSLKDAWERN